MTPEEYFKKWSEHCRIFTDYKPIHSHEDMMNFAKMYHAEQLRIGGVSKSFVCDVEKGITCDDSIPDYKDGKCKNCGGQAN